MLQFKLFNTSFSVNILQAHSTWILNIRVRTILALGYWVLPNIFQYWVLGNTFIGCHTQYQYCLDTLGYQLPADDCREIGEQESWQMKELKMKFNNVSMVETYMAILIGIVWVSWCCIHIHLLKNQYSASL